MIDVRFARFHILGFAGGHSAGAHAIRDAILLVVRPFAHSAHRRVGWLAVILRCEIRPVGARRASMLVLFRRCLHMRFARGRAFLRRRRCRGTARSAVKARTANVRVVDHRLVDVGVVNHGGVHIGDRRVIRETSAAPFSAAKSDSAVSESIIHAAVEAHVRAPNIRREIRRARPRIPSSPESATDPRAAAQPTRPAPKNIRPPRCIPNIPASRGNPSVGQAGCT